TSNAKFHIRMLPSRWYSANNTGSNELFLVADKFTQDQDMLILSNDSPVPYLYLFRQERANFCEENLNTLEQKIIYGKLHGVYKKALNKALQNKSKSQQLIDLLQDFTEEVDLNDISDSDDESQQRQGSSTGTKKLKSSHEVVKPKTKQQHQYKKCENVGHYQKNCKEI
ncbi:39124_t:CDS:2, partial [Gigaspora margarita]